MNDHDLDNLLRAQRSPAREDSYWQEFPGSVVRRIVSRGDKAPAEEGEGRRVRVGWKLALGGACAACLAVLALKFGHGRSAQADVVVARQCYREAAGLFPRQLQAVVMESNGMRLQLAERPDVPDSPPLLVRVYRSSRCVTLVTFSGQQIEMLGGRFEVLADGSGGLILLSREGAWTASKAAGDLWRFDAESMEGRL